MVTMAQDMTKLQVLCSKRVMVQSYYYLKDISDTTVIIIQLGDENTDKS